MFKIVALFNWTRIVLTKVLAPILKEMVMFSVRKINFYVKQYHIRNISEKINYKNKNILAIIICFD